MKNEDLLGRYGYYTGNPWRSAIDSKGKDRGCPWHVIYRRILLARKVTHITENSTMKTVPFAEGTSIY